MRTNSRQFRAILRDSREPSSLNCWARGSNASTPPEVARCKRECKLWIGEEEGRRGEGFHKIRIGRRKKRSKPAHQKRIRAKNQRNRTLIQGFPKNLAQNLQKNSGKFLKPYLHIIITSEETDQRKSLDTWTILIQQKRLWNPKNEKCKKRQRFTTSVNHGESVRIHIVSNTESWKMTESEPWKNKSQDSRWFLFVWKH